jgi:sterol desaturase/sphingolipid hydroxylase (fatty acid hydroxylase superfamily)
MNLPAIVVGFGLGPLAGLILFRGMWATFIHSNVRLPLPGLRVLVGAPELHHWHHHVTDATRHNFSNLAPWTDLLFGTYHCPPNQDFEVGLPGQPSQGYLQWIARPGWNPSRDGNPSDEQKTPRR